MLPVSILHILVQTKGAELAARELARVDSAGKAAGDNLSRTEKHAKRTSGTFKALGSAAKYSAGLAGIGGLAVAVHAIGSEYREAQKTTAQTNAAIKSTGGVAKVTRKEIENLAGAISKKSGIDDEAIQSGENLLLTFTNVRNETGKGNKIFDRATQTITDMSVALGQPLKSSAIQVGKALQDPVKGATALRRVGVQLTDQQKNQIAAFVKSGDKMGAQKVILKELSREFGGAAAAQATAGDKLRVSLGNLAEAAGRILVPALDTVAKYVTGVIDAFVEGKGIAKYIFPVFEGIAKFAGALDPNALKIAGAAIAGIAVSVGLLNVALAANPIVLFAIGVAALGVAVVTAYQKFEGFRKVVDAVFGALKAAAPTVIAVAATIGGALVSAFTAMVGAVRVAVGAVTTAFSAVVGAVQTAVQATITEVSKWKVAFAVVGFIVDVFKAAFSPLAAIARVYLGVVLGVTQAVMAQIINAFRTAWGVVKAVFGGAFTAIKGITLGFGQALHGVIEIIGGILKGDFGQIWNGVKDIFKGAGTALTGIMKGWVQAFVGVISSVGSGIKNAFTSAFDSAKGLVVGFVNDIIGVVEKIPFIGKKFDKVAVPRTQAQSSLGQNAAQAHGYARGGAFGMTGGVVNRPIVMMGEEAPMHPEFVIPTNPAYRKRAQGLVAAAGQAVGFAKGGVVGKLWNAAGGLVSGAAGKLIGALPSNPLKEPLTGMGKTILAKAGAFIKDKVSSVASDVLGGGGGGGSSAIRGGNIGGAGGWPTSPHGKVIGVPYQGTHTLGNWMSDNAIDISVPMGSAVLAVEPGTITRVGGSWGGGASRFDGLTAYLNNEVFYTHMKGRAVKAGQKVHTGDIIGESGAANGVPHLHIGFKPPLKPPGFAKGGIFGARRFAAGGVNGGDQTSTTQPGMSFQGLKLLARDAWGLATGMMGSTGPLPPLKIGVSNPANAFAEFNNMTGNIGISAAMLNGLADPTSPNYSYGLHALIHEFAHARQSAEVRGGLPGRPWNQEDHNLLEGGAEAFARSASSAIYGKLGVKYGGSSYAPYGPEVAWVKKNRTPRWWMHDQFAPSAAGAGKGGKIKRFLSPRRGAKGKAAGVVPARVKAAIDAARRAGFSGTDLVNMVAIAGRESTWIPTAHNLGPKDDSWGLWQINVRPEANPKYKNWKLTDPNVNAKAARELFLSSQKAYGDPLHPWNHAGGPLGDTNVPQARKWVLAMRGAAQTGGATAGGSAGASGGGGGSTTQQPTVLESQQAGLAVRAAELQRRVGGDITDPNTFANTPFARAGKGYDLANANKAAAILKKQQQAIGARIKAIRKGLGRKGITQGTKVRLQNELAQLLPQHAQLGQQRQAILHPQAPDTGGVTGDTGDPNQGLIDAINAQIEQERINTEAMKAHTDALNAVQAEVKRQTDFAAAVSTTEAFQIKKMLTDVVAGGMGALVAQRSGTPGSGGVAQY
jgi:murein DD-endopeptidase MepM/ murein hydrolase activator NlpD